MKKIKNSPADLILQTASIDKLNSPERGYYKGNNMKDFINGIILGLIAFALPTIVYAFRVGAL
jgi:hypothetical protein